MKPSLLFGLFCIVLLWSACTSYHYVAPNPVIPSYQSAGEIESQFGFSEAGFNFQASYSVFKSFGAYAGFRGSSRSSNSFFSGVNFQPTLFNFKTIRPFATLGYERSAYYDRESNGGGIFVQPRQYSDYTYRSLTEHLKSGFGINFYVGDKRQVLICAGMGYEKMRVLQLSTNGKHINYNEESTSKNFIYSPKETIGTTRFLALQYTFDFGLVLRQSVMWLHYREDEFSSYSIYETPGYHLAKGPSTIQFLYKPVYYSFSIGINVDLIAKR